MPLQLLSLIRADGELEVSLAECAMPEPRVDEVVVRIEASPINPSDLGLLFGAADLSTIRVSGTQDRPVLTATIPSRAMPAMAGRIGQAMPVGNEGAGVVVSAGASSAAQALLGKTVALLGGGMYAQYRCVNAAQCFALPEGTTPAQGAAFFVNPLTALGMVETMRHEGHRALVHNPGASNLGQMLNRLCLHDGIGLVNIVRKSEHEQLLRAAGAVHVCNSASPDFVADLKEALEASGATLAFDAAGGGKLAGQILASMEAVLAKSSKGYSRYGTSTHKQVYLYGNLDRGPTEFTRSFGMSWGMGGWLVFNYLQKLGEESTKRLKARVAAELTTTFASSYAKEVSLAQALQQDAIAEYGKQATGGKYLLNPNGGV